VELRAGGFRDIIRNIPLAIFAGYQGEIGAAVALSVMVPGFAFVAIPAFRYLAARITGHEM
jgi:hypothetical protein